MNNTEIELIVSRKEQSLFDFQKQRDRATIVEDTGCALSTHANSSHLPVTHVRLQRQALQAIVWPFAIRMIWHFALHLNLANFHEKLNGDSRKDHAKKVFLE